MTSIQHPEPPADIVAQFKGQKVEVLDGWRIAPDDKTIADVTAAALKVGLRVRVLLPLQFCTMDYDMWRLNVHVSPHYEADAPDSKKGWRIASFTMG